ncbi:hypothetical protein [Aeromicrobium sp. 9AM]|uniref:hypothetical protein n=1 Tax=Aeromicrobium sp. 9AM TaxID=2653126 RepID=UPI0012F3177D|nr:hypothetical protein [Aeromicrobium sp. 9AM]VXB15055.1 conserved hypothetical protein [Aeromicrobium sp. 9AM]
MNNHIIDALRPEPPAIDPVWEAETVRAITEGRVGSGKLTTNRRGRLMGAGLVAAAVVALIAGVAVARHSLPPDHVRPAEPVKDKIQKITPAKAEKLKLGDTLDVVAELPKTYNGDGVLFSSFIASNVLVGSATPELDEGAPGVESLAQSHPVMYDLDTKKFTLLDDRDRPDPTQVVDVSGDGDTVVWAELVGTSIGTSEFTIYSYDQRTGQVTTLGAFNDPDGQIVYGDDLALAGDTAYFSTAAYPAKRGQQGVYAVPVDGSKTPRMIAKGGQGVRISGETLTYAMSNPKNKEQPRYFTYDLPTGMTMPVPVSAHADDPGFCGAEVTKAWETWCVGEPATLTIKEASGRTTEFDPFPVGSLTAPDPHDVIALGRWTGIAATTDDGQDREFLVDLDTKEMKVFPDNTSFTSLSPDGSTVLISSYAGKGPGPQRLVRIPD